MEDTPKIPSASDTTNPVPAPDMAGKPEIPSASEGKNAVPAPDSIRNDVAVLVSEEVKKQLDAERAIIKGAVGVAWKIIGISAALLLVLLTIFGVKTYTDINNLTTAYVKQQVDALILKNDAETGVKQQLNDLVNRAIISSSLTELQRNPKEKIELPLNSWNRLKEWLKEPGLGTQEFSDVLTVLDSQSEERKKEDANSILSEMLNPPKESRYSWIRKQPNKRLALMTSFRHQDMGSSAMDVLTNDDLSEELRIAAVRYVKQVQYTERFDKLIKLAENSEIVNLKLQTYAACAALRPTYPKFLELLKKLFTPPPTDSKILLAVVALGEIWFEGAIEPMNWDDRDALRKLGKDMFALVVSNSAFLFIRAQRQSRTFKFLLESELPPPQIVLMIPTSSRGWLEAGSISVTEFSRLKPYWDLLADAANAGDLTRLATYLPCDQSFLEFGPILWNVSVKASLEPESKIVVAVSSASSLTLSSAMLKEIAFLRGSYESQDIDVRWIENDGKAGQGKVTKISGGGFAFSIDFKRR